MSLQQQLYRVDSEQGLPSPRLRGCLGREVEQTMMEQESETHVVQQIYTDTQTHTHKLCRLVHKALVGHAPQYIADLIRPVADLPSGASLWTAHSGNLYVPRTCRRFGDRAFAVAAPRV